MVVLISGEGRNLQAFIDGIDAGIIPARIEAVIANRADAPGLARARSAGIPAEVLSHDGFASRAEFDAALAARIDLHAPRIVALAGFMRILGEDFVHRYRGRLVNIHPSLLPKFPGLRTHAQALAAGEPTHGATVHFVTGELDGGPAIVQAGLSILPQDTAEALAARVMQDIELRIYPQALAWLARGEVALEGDHVLRHGQRLALPLSLADLEPAFR